MQILLLFLLAFSAIAHSATAADAPHLEWSIYRGTSEGDSAEDIAVDRWGNVHVVGDTSGVFPGQSGTDHGDAFLATYCHEPWRTFSAQQWGTDYSDRATSVTVDALGYVYVAGHSNAPDSRRRFSAFYRKYTPLGRLLIDRKILIGNWTQLVECRVAPCGRFLVAGDSLNHPTAGGSMSFVRQYDRCGRIEWTNYLGESRSENPRLRALTVLPGGDAAVVGFVYGQIDGEPTNGRVDGFVARFGHKDGDRKWLRRSKRAGRDWTWGITAGGFLSSTARCTSSAPTGADCSNHLYVCCEVERETAGNDQDANLTSTELEALHAENAQQYEWVIEVVDGEGDHVRDLKPGFSGAARNAIVARDGTLFVAGTYRVARIDNRGRVLWYEPNGSWSSTLTMDAQGAIYHCGHAPRHRGQRGEGMSDFYIDKYELR